MYQILLFLFAFSSLFSASFGPYKEYKYSHLELFAKFLPDDPVIFEAGGHYGIDTVQFSQRWPNGSILTFEPNPNAYAKLIKATKDLENVHPYNLAVNTYNGTATLHVCYGTSGDNPEYEGASSLLEASESMKIHYQGPKVEVPCVILDDWCQENQVDHIDLMWLDLEGMELQLLKSSPHILKTVKVIYTETNFYDFRIGMTRYQELKQFLQKSGFQLAAHWYIPEIQGNAVFIRKDLFP